jgi:hypothetical protein
MAQVRQGIDEKKGQLDAKHAESRAEDAEVDALFAIDYAYATVEDAEYAVLDALQHRDRSSANVRCQRARRIVAVVGTTSGCGQIAS